MSRGGRTTNGHRLEDIRALLVDLDGVIYRGNTPLPGVPEFFRTLQDLDIRYTLLTNNSTLTTEQFVAKVRKMGVPADDHEVLSSAEATATYLSQVAPAGVGVYVIGETGLHESIRRHGFDVESRDPKYVVIGMDRALTYEKLRRGCTLLIGGAGFIASNPDVTLPTEDGLIPGSGAIMAFLRACSGVEPLVIGKPGTRMLEIGVQRMGIARQQTAMLGDRLDTDVVAGRAAGTPTILVLTGISNQEEVDNSDYKPDFVYADLIELAAAMRTARKRA
jgi:4-nitrophenyl phosphatase